MKSCLLFFYILIAPVHMFGQQCNPPKGWSIRFCLEKTEASGAELWYRTGGCDKCEVFNIVWKKGEATEIILPVELRYAREIWLRAKTLEDGKNIYLCLYYNDQSVRMIECDGNPETHDSEYTDRRKCKCN